MGLTIKGPNHETRDDAERIILGIIHEAGGEFVGASRLNKVFWLAHLLHWQDQEGVLTAHPIVKLGDGPAIDNRTTLLDRMESRGDIERGTYGDCGDKYKATGTPPTLTDAERDSISKALKRIGGMGYDALSAWSHRLSWERADTGEEQNIYLDLMTDDEREQLAASELQSQGVIRRVFG